MADRGSTSVGRCVPGARHRGGVADAEAARRVLRAYFEDIAGRYHGRPATASEVAEAMRQEPSDDLAPPTALLLLAYGDGGVLGCAGLRLADPPGDSDTGRVGEVTRVFVEPAARRRGLGARREGPGLSANAGRRSPRSLHPRGDVTVAAAV